MSIFDESEVERIIPADDGQEEGHVREYKLAGPSPKPFRRRPTVQLDGRAIREVIPAQSGGRYAEAGCIVVLHTGARVHVTAYASTVTRHMVDSANASVAAPEAE